MMAPLCRAIVSLGLVLVIFSPAPSAPAADEIISFDFSELAASFHMDQRSSVRVVGDGLAVAVDMPFARPQDRYVMALLDIDPGIERLESSRILVSLKDVKTGDAVAEGAAMPTARRGRVLLDVRRAPGSHFRLRIERRKGGSVLAVGETLIGARDYPTPPKAGDRIRVGIDLPEGVGSVQSRPLTFGVPFPAGALWDVGRLSVVDDEGRPLPAQMEITGRWAKDGAIKWVRVDALAGRPGGCNIAFRNDREDLPKPTQPVKVVETENGVNVTVAGVTYVLGKGHSPIRAIRRGERILATADGARGLYVMNQNDLVGDAASDDETMTVEARGPVAASVRFEGFYRAKDGTQFARHITRCEFFAGQPAVNVTHTLILTNDTNELWLKEAGWEFTVKPGANPAALFALSRGDWRKTVRTPVGEDQIAFMIQDDHTQFGGGRNHFYVARQSDKADPERLAEGTECGDWAALAGDGGGLMVSCRDTALQHPKEFAVSPGHFSFLLFSNRTGEAIDFRPEALIKRWNKGGRLSKGNWLEQIRKTESNAVGWSKTHQFFFRATPPNPKPEALAELSRLHSQPVLAMPDPEWIHRSRVLGPLHPKDPKRFPEVEAFIEKSFEPWRASAERFDEYGFIDYWSGPHYSGFPSSHRYRLSYTLRNDAWLLYARSGDRKIFDFASNTARTFMDAMMARWDGPSRGKGLSRIRGLFLSSGGSFYDKLPYYWENGAYPEFSTDTTLNHILTYYHLCGYRRGKDVVEEYQDGLKRWWGGAPSQFRRTWRPLMLLRCLRQSYTLTWDDDLRTMINSVLNFVYDPEITVALTKDRPYNSPTYKTATDVSSVIRTYRQFGGPRLHEMADKLSRYWWYRYLGRSTQNRLQRGLVADFLYEETKAPAIAAGLALSMRQQTGETGPTGVSQVVARFQGLPYSQSVVARAGADTNSLISWAGFDDFGFPVRLVTSKGKQDTLKLTVNTRNSFDVGGNLEVKPVGRVSGYGLGGIQLREYIGRSYDVLIPKDADAGAFALNTNAPGETVAVTNGRFPLVVYAPEYFRPAPVIQHPFAPIYFKLPEGEKDGAIFFEGLARLFDPEGKPHGDGKPIRGWVDLPPDKPGLWSFQPVENWLVKVRNLPPFFAFRDPAYYFEPAIPWEREPPPDTSQLPAEQLYAPGVSGLPGDKALHLTGKRPFTLEGGKPLGKGRRSEFLPFHEGTIEWYFKPQWSTFDLWPKTRKPLIRLDTDGPPWQLLYAVQPDRDRWPPMRSHYSHVFRPSFQTTHESTRLRSFYACRRAIVERGEWIHVAWVWGQKTTIGAHRDKKSIVTQRVYVNGKLGQNFHYSYVNVRPRYRPQRLTLTGAMDGLVDKLRVSDNMRYNVDFDPPARDRPLTVDEHTLAVFEFDGNVDGKGMGGASLPTQLIQK